MLQCVHPELRGTVGHDIVGSISPSPSFGKITEGACGALWTAVGRGSEVDTALSEGMRAIKEEKR